MSGITFNQDCTEYLMRSMGETPDAVNVAAWVDGYLGTQVTELFLNPNAMRTAYDSAVWESYWHGYRPDAADDAVWLEGVPASWFAGIPPAVMAPLRAMVHQGWLLHKAGIDLYDVWTRRSRAHGLPCWLSMRMNDVHYTLDPLHPMHSTFWRTHPELWRVPYRATHWEDRALDYGQPAVRARALALLREWCARYDFTGIELDWMRYPQCLRPGYERKDAPLLTAFVGEVRGLLDDWQDRRGHPIRLGARVPSSPQTAWQLGLDAAAWARDGLLDWLTVSPLWGTIESAMPLELWRALLGEAPVTLAGALEINLTPHSAFPSYPVNSLATVRGAAASLLDRGADRVYLFNYFDTAYYQALRDGIPPLAEAGVLGADYPALLHEVGSLATLAGKARRHVLTYSTCHAPGQPVAAPLPASGAPGAWLTFRLPSGPPSTAPARVVLGVAAGEAPAVRLGGIPCPLEGPVALPAPAPEGSTYAYRIPREAAQRGGSIIETTSSTACTLDWVEIAIDEE